jgi:uncharacterized protein (DUF1919 family)
MKPFCSRREMITEQLCVSMDNAAWKNKLALHYKPTLEEEIAIEAELDACFA